MLIGVPTEVKPHEYRVALTPAGARELVAQGHDVWVHSGAGVGSGIADSDFQAAGARVVDGVEDLWRAADMVLKVKEPIASEFSLLRAGQILFTYLHLAAAPELARVLLDQRVVALAYETVALDDGTLPLLAPMSEVAGRLAPQVGAQALLRSTGGRGVLPGGVPGVEPATVVVIGAGVSGMNAAQVASGMGADVVLLDTDVTKLRAADALFRGGVKTVASSVLEIDRLTRNADLVIGAVLVAGGRAPRLISNDQVAGMKPGSVLVDISIDQGGCFEDSRPTTHDNPTFPVHESTFYCVANMPGAVPHTSTRALTNATLPFVLALAGRGWKAAARSNAALRRGLNSAEGHVSHAAVAEALGERYVDPLDLCA